MQAMIFAAGLGSRLKEYTANKPKALVPYQGKTLLLHTIERLQSYGIRHIVINVHHFAQQIIDYVNELKLPDTHISFSNEQDKLLDTGGALKKAAPLFSTTAPILLTNVDLLTNINFNSFSQTYYTNQPLALLAVRQRESSRHLLFDSKQQLCGWENTLTGEDRPARNPQGSEMPYAFSGMQIVHPKILQLSLPQDRYSIIDLYLHLATKYPIEAYVDQATLWKDMGKIEDWENN